MSSASTTPTRLSSAEAAVEAAVAEVELVAAAEVEAEAMLLVERRDLEEVPVELTEVESRKATRVMMMTRRRPFFLSRTIFLTWRRRKTLESLATRKMTRRRSLESPRRMTRRKMMEKKKMTEA